MRKLSISILSALALVTAGAASAADLPVKARPAAMTPVPQFSWTGIYVGLNAGYGWGDTSGTLFSTAPGNVNLGGALAGGQIGANYQFNNIVLGIEADYQWADIDGSSTTLAGVIRTAEVERFGTVRGRLGFAWDRWLAYVTGGYAFGAKTNVSIVPGTLLASSATLDGWTAGVGVEYAFAPNWSAKLEYLHIDLNDKTFFSGLGACAVTSLCQTGANIDLVRVGLNYRFGANWR
jgi:outer membrane immunogenic protein